MDGNISGNDPRQHETYTLDAIKNDAMLLLIHQGMDGSVEGVLEHIYPDYGTRNRRLTGRSLEDEIPKGFRWTKPLLKLGGSGRRVYWMEAINMLSDHLWWGVGINAYSLAARQYKITWGGYPHNCYLQIAVEIGIVGFFSFLAILFVITGCAFSTIKRSHDVFIRSIQIGALAAFIGFLFHSFFDTFFFSVQLGSLMWIVMGILVSGQGSVVSDQRKEVAGC